MNNNNEKKSKPIKQKPNKSSFNNAEKESITAKENKIKQKPKIKKEQTTKPIKNKPANINNKTPLKKKPQIKAKPQTRSKPENIIKQKPQSKEIQQPISIQISEAEEIEIKNKLLNNAENEIAEKNKKFANVREYEEVRVKKKKVKKFKTLYAIFGIITDIFIYPVIIISLFSSFFMFASKSQNQVTNVLGISVVRIKSGSMIASGFNIGDMVFVNQNLKSEVKVGDVIAFYYKQTSVSSGTVMVCSQDGEGIKFDDEYVTYTSSGVTRQVERKVKEYSNRQELISNADVYFHYILEIHVNDNTGEVYYKTKGSSNPTADSYLIRSDLLVGKYVSTPAWLRGVFKFCSTSTGMLILVVFPLSILILFELLSILEQCSNIYLEKKVLQRKEPFNSSDAIKGNICIELNDILKIYFYDIIPEREQPKLYDMQWGYLKEIKLNKKQQHYFDAVEESLRIYEKTNSEPYWDYWTRFYAKSPKKSKNLAKAKNKAFAYKLENDGELINVEKSTKKSKRLSKE